MTALTDADRRLLDVAGRRYTHAGSLETAVRDELGLTYTRYLQRLNALIDTEAALAYTPALVKRLRRIAGRAG